DETTSARNMTECGERVSDRGPVRVIDGDVLGRLVLVGVPSDGVDEGRHVFRPVDLRIVHQRTAALVPGGGLKGLEASCAGAEVEPRACGNVEALCCEAGGLCHCGVGVTALRSLSPTDADPIVGTQGRVREEE